MGGVRVGSAWRWRNLKPFLNGFFRVLALCFELGKGLLEDLVPFAGNVFPGEAADPLVGTVGDGFDFVGVIVNPKKFVDCVVDIGKGTNTLKIHFAVHGPFGGCGTRLDGNASDSVFDDFFYIVNVI